MQSQHKQDIDTVRYVATESQDVSINMQKLKELSMEVISYISRNNDNKNFDAVAFNYVRLSSEFHPDKDDRRAADWLFVLNTLNFGLWTRKETKEWKINGLTGYLALCAAIKRAIDDGIPIWDPKFYTELSKAEMIRIFLGDDNIVIPRISRRLIILHDVGKVLLNNYDGTFANCIKSCDHDAIKLMITVHNTFPSYRDVAKYGDRIVNLYTKAWVLISDVWSYFDGKHELGIEIKGIKYSTIFADYRTLQVLNHFNVLVYSKNFSNELEKEVKILIHGNRQELEIRCCSLMIMRYLHQMLVEEFQQNESIKRITKLGSLNFDCMCLLDNFLWDFRQVHDEQLKKNVLCKIYTEQY